MMVTAPIESIQQHLSTTISLHRPAGEEDAAWRYGSGEVSRGILKADTPLTLPADIEDEISFISLNTPASPARFHKMKAMTKKDMMKPVRFSFLLNVQTQKHEKGYTLTSFTTSFSHCMNRPRVRRTRQLSMSQWLVRIQKRLLISNQFVTTPVSSTTFRRWVRSVNLFITTTTTTTTTTILFIFSFILVDLHAAHNLYWFIAMWRYRTIRCLRWSHCFECDCRGCTVHRSDTVMTMTSIFPLCCHWHFKFMYVDSVECSKPSFIAS